MLSPCRLASRAALAMSVSTNAVGNCSTASRSNCVRASSRLRTLVTMCMISRSSDPGCGLSEPLPTVFRDRSPLEHVGGHDTNDRHFLADYLEEVASGDPRVRSSVATCRPVAFQALAEQVRQGKAKRCQHVLRGAEAEAVNQRATVLE